MMKMDLVYLDFFILTLVVSLMLILLQPSSINAEHYVIKQHQRKAVSAPSVNASKPISARSPTECVLKCKNKPGGKYTQPFYSNQNECFCLKNDQQKLDTLTQSKGKEIDGLMYLKIGNNRNTPSLTTQSNPGTSCKSIKQQHGSSALSGLYWINLSPASQVYCDMETDGGGWLLIGRIVTTAQNIDLYNRVASVMSSKFSDLHLAATKNFLLNGNTFSNVKSLIGFTEYRVFCHKPYHGRTNHAKFSNSNANSLPLFNYATTGTPAPSNLCNALVYMPDDNSLTKSLACTSLKPSKVSLDQRLYNYIWFVSSKTHVAVWSNDQMFCDDWDEPGYNNYGTWLFYVK